MTPEDLHGLPSTHELIEATREWLRDDIAPVVDGRDAFMVRVVDNVLAQVSRELTMGAEQATAVTRELERLGFADEATLAAALRRGEVDHRDASVVRTVRAIVDARLAVANPRYVERR